MKRTKLMIGLMTCVLSGGIALNDFNAFAADVDLRTAATQQPQVIKGPSTIDIPEVKPAGPGVFSMKKQGASNLHLSVKAHVFVSRDEVEKYLAYRAAEQTMASGYSWFTFIPHRAKGDKSPESRTISDGIRYSFRLQFWQPVWRYRLAGASAWKTWSQSSGSQFWADGVDPKSITDYEADADISMHKGMVQDDNPLAFDASALSDYLINQVTPPK